MSTSIAPSTALRPWRVIIVVAVAALALGIGVTLGSFLLTTRAAAFGSAASYVPASAPFYVEIRVEPSAAQDAALREFLGHFPPIEGLDLDEPLVDQLTAHFDEALAAEGADVSWSEDIAPWFDGRVAVAVLEVPIAAADPTLFQQATVHNVQPGYFEAIGARVIEGRTFTEQENNPDARTVVR